MEHFHPPTANQFSKFKSSLNWIVERKIQRSFSRILNVISACFVTVKDECVMEYKSIATKVDK